MKEINQKKVKVNSNQWRKQKKRNATILDKCIFNSSLFHEQNTLKAQNTHSKEEYDKY